MIFMLELLSLVAVEVHHQKIRLQQNMAVELLVVLLLLDMELHKLLQVQMVHLVKVVLQQLLELIIINGSGGGGGGWYGGGACSNYSDSTNYQGYNGGGSGYVYTSATAANYPKW